MEHRKISSRSSGHDGWRIVCSCGWSTFAWRWLAEERFTEHSAPTFDLDEPDPPRNYQLNEDPDEPCPLTEEQAHGIEGEREVIEDQARHRRALVHPNYHDGF